MIPLSWRFRAFLRKFRYVPYDSAAEMLWAKSGWKMIIE